MELEDFVFQGFNVYILIIDFNSGNKQHTFGKRTAQFTADQCFMHFCFYNVIID